MGDSAKDDERNQDSMATELDEKSQQLSSVSREDGEEGAAAGERILNKSKSFQGDRAKNKPAKPSAGEHARSLKKFRDYYNGELGRIEKTNLGSLNNDTNPAYRASWREEANRFYKLTVNFDSRLRSLGSKRKKSS